MAYRIYRWRRWLFAALATLVLAACATPTPTPVPVAIDPATDLSEPPQPEPQIPVIKEPPPVVVERPPVAEPIAPVAIVLASREPAYDDVVNELGKHLENYSIYDLSDKSQPPESAFRAINDDNALAVVAVGLHAARAAILLSQQPVIFSQVFNYSEHGLTTDFSRGVASIAPLDAQLANWKKLDPGITEIGFIIGEGHERLIEAATLAALEQDINLIVRVSHSDQETLYLYKRMVADIDGFWMMPDNRILSARVIREILDDAHRRNVAVAVSHDAILPMGAAISFTTSAANIAETIVGVLRSIQTGGIASVPELTELSEIRVRTNDAILQKRLIAENRPIDAEEAE